MKSKKPTCQTCRERKVRCDGGVSSCERCIRSGRQCSYPQAAKRGLSFRHSHLSLIGRQGLQSIATSEPCSPASTHVYLSPEVVANTPAGCGVHTVSPSSALNGSLSDSIHAEYPLPNSAPLSQTPNNHGRMGRGHQSSLAIPSSAPELSPQEVGHLVPTIWDRDSSLQLSTVEAECMQFYVDEIGPWLDSTSPERYFTYTVPLLALRCNVLFYPIIACAAHILRLRDNDRLDMKNAEELYQHEAVQLLIPMLENVEFNYQNEVVFAAIGTLRMSEQWEEFVDQQYHLVPDCFISYGPLEKSSTAEGGLREATFYAYIRADIRMAILNKCCTKMKPSTWPLDTNSPSSDADWANRATWLLLQTINLCYGDHVPGVPPRQELECLVEDWKDSIPESFRPYILQKSNTDSFPVMRLLCPWHVVGLQFYHACKILLVTSKPTRPEFSDIISFNRYMTSNILVHARSICGIAFSNKDFGTRMNGSHLVTLAGQYFTGQAERSRVLQYMNMLQDDHAWPSKTCLEMLEQAYEGPESETPRSAR